MSQQKQVSEFLAVKWKANLRVFFFLLQKKQQSGFRWSPPLKQLKLQTGLSPILPSKHKTTRSSIKQKKAQISFVGCQQCTIYTSEELTQSEAEFQGKTSLRWSSVVKLTRSILLTTSAFATGSGKSCFLGFSQGVGWPTLGKDTCVHSPWPWASDRAATLLLPGSL